MTQVYCPFLVRVMRGRAKALTFSLLLGLGVGGAVGCSGDDDQPQEAVKADAGETGDVAANPDGDAVSGSLEGGDTKAETPAAGDDAVADFDAAPPPAEAQAEAPPVATTDVATAEPSDGAAPELPAEQESDAMLNDAEATAPIQETAEITPPIADDSQVTLQAPVHTETAKTAKFQPVSANVGNGAKGSGGSYIVQPGDTLAGISAKIYGQSDMWHPLAMLNGINEPYRIFPGDELQFDSSNGHSKTFAQSQNANGHSVTVKRGDTLSSIAQSIYGNAGHWKVIYAHNKDQIQDPNRIEVGMVLNYIAQGNASAKTDDAQDEVAPDQPVKKVKKSATTEAPAKKGKKTAGKVTKKPTGKIKKTTGH